jgi:hypothetical protein
VTVTAQQPYRPEAGFAAHERRMRPVVEIGRLHVRGLEVPDPAAAPEWDPALIDRAINGVDLPDHPGLPGS